jgi:hypothetical protein
VELFIVAKTEASKKGVTYQIIREGTINNHNGGTNYEEEKEKYGFYLDRVTGCNRYYRYFGWYSVAYIGEGT